MSEIPVKLSRRLRKRLHLRADARLEASGWYDLSSRSEMDAVFVGGCGRSGTTLFKELLNRHSRFACGPETSLYGLPFRLENIAAPWGIPLAELEVMRARSGSLVAFADEFAGAFLAAESKARWVEKTPNNVRAIERLLTWYPNGRFIHVVRDGRDVVCSLRHHPKERVRGGKIVPVRVTNPVGLSARRWLSDTMRGLAFRQHPRCLEVRYESLVADPEREMHRVCDFVGEAFEAGMMTATPDAAARPGQNMNNDRAAGPISSGSVGRWVSDLRPEERATFVDIAGELLIALGYAPDHSWAEMGGGSNA
jgi:hypothetical protein